MEKIIEIKQWLAGDQSFDSGLALYAKHSRNKQMLKTIMRRKSIDKLVWELQTLAGIPAISKTKAKVYKATKQPVVLPSQTNEPIQPKEKQRIIIDDGRIKYEDLPPEGKSYYDEIRTTYKEIRAIHEKMKQSTEDKERAHYRTQLIKRDDKVRENWKKLDSLGI